jgi:hypothetical protein
MPTSRSIISKLSTFPDAPPGRLNTLTGPLFVTLPKMIQRGVHVVISRIGVYLDISEFFLKKIESDKHNVRTTSKNFFTLAKQCFGI